MSARPYNLGRRRASTERTRARIIRAARKVTVSSRGIGAFSIEAVARRAGVARMTVYYQFGSKRGLLEALFDDIASRSLATELPAAFSRPEPLDALAGFIDAFVAFWSSERPVIRRIRSIAALDSGLEPALRARDERRRAGLRVIMQRLAENYGKPRPEELDDVVDVLHTLTGFETYDTLAGATRTSEDVAGWLRRLALTFLGFHVPP